MLLIIELQMTKSFIPMYYWGNGTFVWPKVNRSRHTYDFLDWAISKRPLLQSIPMTFLNPCSHKNLPPKPWPHPMSRTWASSLLKEQRLPTSWAQTFGGKPALTYSSTYPWDIKLYLPSIVYSEYTVILFSQFWASSRPNVFLFFSYAVSGFNADSIAIMLDYLL